MRHRAFRVALLWFTTAWFGVVVPGHRRGQVTLPGWASGCCAASTSHGDRSRHVPPAQPSQCAVCHYLAMLDLPTPVQLDAPPLAFARPAIDLPQPSHFSAELRTTCLERGPPTA